MSALRLVVAFTAKYRLGQAVACSIGFTTIHSERQMVQPIAVEEQAERRVTNSSQ
jgi:hypothetical protein